MLPFFKSLPTSSKTRNLHSLKVYKSTHSFISLERTKKNSFAQTNANKVGCGNGLFYYSTIITKKGASRPSKLATKTLQKNPIEAKKPVKVSTFAEDYERHYNELLKQGKEIIWEDDSFVDLEKEAKRNERKSKKELSTIKKQPLHSTSTDESFMEEGIKEESTTDNQEMNKTELKDDSKEKTKTVFLSGRKKLWPAVPRESKYSKLWNDYSSQANNYKFRQSKVMQIRDLALVGKAEEAIKLFEEMRKDSFEKKKISPFMFDQLMLSCSRSGKWNKAFNLYNTMKKFQFKPTIKTMNILISCLGNVVYSKDRDPIQQTREKIEYIRNQMIKYDIKPTIREYNVLFRTLGKIGDLNGCLYLMDELFSKKSDIKPDVTTFTILIENIGKNDYKQAFVIWDYMKDQTYIKPDLYLYNTLMKVCNESDQSALTIELFSTLKEEKIKPDKRTIAMMATAYAKLGVPSQAPLLLYYLKNYKIQRDEFVMNSIFRLGTMKKWALSENRENLCKSDVEFFEKFESDLMEYKVSTSKNKLKPSPNLLSNLEIEMFFIGAVSIGDFKRSLDYYKLAIERRIYPPNKYEDRFRNLCMKNKVPMPMRPFLEERGPKKLENETQSEGNTVEDSFDHNRTKSSQKV